MLAQDWISSLRDAVWHLIILANPRDLDVRDVRLKMMGKISEIKGEKGYIPNRCRASP